MTVHIDFMFFFSSSA
jgi:hypothetical protein